MAASHPQLSERFLYCEGEPVLLFTENETNNERIFGTPNPTPFVKDAFDRYIVHGQQDAVNPERTGTKASADYKIEVEPGEGKSIRLRLVDVAPGSLKQTYPTGDPLGRHFDEVISLRRAEADEFYSLITPSGVDEDTARLVRQASAGMLWTKQYYFYDVDRWLKEHGVDRQTRGATTRNQEWFHMVNDDIISMPDKWEYPWYAAWDLAFHAVALSVLDVDFAKQQLNLMLESLYLHPSGQIPAYEWNFSDVNPPVHAWATLFIYNADKAQRGKGDIEFLKRAFNKLILNFTWWVNRKDRFGKNVFEGGFLGLDNIGVFDRSAPLPVGGHLEQADGTAWMALFSQNMTEIAEELAVHDPVYEEFVVKFVEHFMWIAVAINGHDGLWDEEDGFYYDLLRLSDGTSTHLRVRSMVGLLPLCAISVVEKYQRDSAPDAGTHFRMRLRQMPEVAGSIHPTGAGNLGVNERGIFALVDPDKLRRILSRMLDEKEFLSDYGILFYEYFHGDNGAGLGASHQTGWTGLVARLIQMYGQFDATSILEQGKRRR